MITCMMLKRTHKHYGSSKLLESLKICSNYSKFMNVEEVASISPNMLPKVTKGKRYTAPVRLELTTFRLYLLLHPSFVITVGRCNQLSHGAPE
jgi:hypothetical protein